MTSIATSTPEAFICPITDEIMQDPVVDGEGVSYERAAITRWLALHQTSPVTRKPLTIARLIPNLALKELIQNHQNSTETNPIITVRIVPYPERMSGEDIPEEELNAQTTQLGGCKSCDGYTCFQDLFAEIKQGDTQIGKISMQLLQRPNQNFMEACDAADADLYNVGSTFFDNSGRCKVKSVCQTEAAEGIETGREGLNAFLHISNLTLTNTTTNDASNTTNIVASALRSLLLNSSIAGEWSIAIYVPDSFEARRKFNSDNNLTPFSDLTDAQDLAKSKVLREAQEKDASSFVRSGFRQVIDKGILANSTCEYFYATPGFLQGNMMSHSNAVGVPYLRKHVNVPLSGKNKEMFDHVQQYVSNLENQRMQNGMAMAMSMTTPGTSNETTSSSSSSSSTFTITSTVTTEQLQELNAIVDQHIANGSNIAKTPLLHLVCALQQPEFIELLLNKGADVDLVDEEGYTALMVAAGSAYGKSSLLNTPPSECIELLVNAGADKKSIAPEGVSALGMYWKGKKESTSFHLMMGMHTSKETPERKAAGIAMDEKIQGLLSVTDTVPNEEDLIYSSGGSVEDETRAINVLDMICLQQGTQGGAIEMMATNGGVTAMELLKMVIPDENMREQMLMMHDSLGSLMSGHGFDEDEDY